MATSVVELAVSIENINGKDLDALREEFTVATEAGTVTPIVEPTIATETPAECQQSTHDARQRVVDLCLEKNI